MPNNTNRRSFVSEKLNLKKTNSLPSSPLNKSLSISTLQEATQTNKSNKKEKSFHEFDLQVEYANLTSLGCPKNIYCIPKEDDYYTWFGVIFIKNNEKYGSYKGGVFEFTIEISTRYRTNSNSYPKIPPITKFKTDTMHPSIDQRGTLKLFKWLQTIHLLHDLIKYIDFVFSIEYFKKLTMEQVLNRDAYNMFVNENEIFRRLVVQCVNMSTLDSTLFRNKEVEMPGSIAFKPISEQKYKDLKTQIAHSYK